MDSDKDETPARNDEVVVGSCMTLSVFFTEAFCASKKDWDLHVSLSMECVLYQPFPLTDRDASVIKGLSGSSRLWACTAINPYDQRRW
jgi:hypothetical protein